MNITSLYLDNFRGFHDTLIPLNKVTFFVGENSAGKTSILKILDLLTSGQFWWHGQFRSENVDFSYYGDIANPGSVTKLGILCEEKDSKGKIAESMVLLTLTSNRNNQTTLKSMRCAYGGIELQILLSPNSKRNKYKLLDDANLLQEEFKTWCSYDISTDGYRFVKKSKQPFMDNSPYFTIGNLLDDNRVPPSFMSGISPYTWIAPIRIKPQQTYDGNIYDYSPDGAHSPYVLKNILSKKGSSTSRKIISALDKYGKESGLFESIDVRKFAKYGNSPFSIEIKIDGKNRHITNVGYGVSQVLPIITEILSHSGYKFAIQQPEVHLHPRAQASLGGFFFDIAHSSGVHLVIETHSDFLIDRYRQRMHGSKAKSEPYPANVIFFEHEKNGNIAHNIQVNSDGTYDAQPDGFRRFFFNEELRNLQI